MAVVSEASAPGKLILFGEHAVVYGATAIAGALSDLRIHARVVRRQFLTFSLQYYETTSRLQFVQSVPCTGGVPCASTPNSTKFGCLPVSFGMYALAPRAPVNVAVCLSVHVIVSACVQTLGSVDGLHLVIPDIANPAASVTLELSFAALRGSALGPILVDLKEPTGAAFKPNTGTLAALEALVEECPKAHRKGMIPCLFLAATMFAPIIVAPEPSLRGVELVICKPTLPIAAGLGSSAAFSVATASALLDAWLKHAGEPRGLLPDATSGVTSPGTAFSTTSPTSQGFVPPSKSHLPLINDWAYAAEMLFHGAPSGLDNTVSTYVFA